MLFWMVWWMAIAGIEGCLIFWLRDVQRIMQERKSMVDSAAGQLATYRERAAALPEDPAVAAVLARSEHIYSQAVDIYNRTIEKVWVYLPAVLLGFRKIA